MRRRRGRDNLTNLVFLKMCQKLNHYIKSCQNLELFTIGKHLKMLLSHRNNSYSNHDHVYRVRKTTNMADGYGKGQEIRLQNSQKKAGPLSWSNKYTKLLF